MMQIRLQFRIAVITAIALLIAQIGAMTHAYSHVAQVAPPSAHQSLLNSHDFCNDCLNFAPLLSAAGTPAALPVVVPQGRGFGLTAACRSLVNRRPLLAFRSRAPPVAYPSC